MPLEIRYGRTGKLRTSWYGRFEANGKRLTLNLGVKIHGTPPASGSLRDEGDTAFERSRAHAQAKLDRLIEDARRKHDSVHLVERLYEIKTGEQIKKTSLEKLPDEWSRIPRRRPPNPRYAAQCRSSLSRFASFVRDHHPRASELNHVTREAARAFMEAESSRGVTAKTWNDTLKLLRATCKHLLPAGSINPFSDIPTRETETVFRKPFTPEELKAIVDAAHDDEFTRPILVTGICTAMRRGDCCLLKWADVDMDRRFISVKTGKTGTTVAIPILPMLFDELSRRPRTPSPYVFPEAAAMYRENPDGITWRVRRVLATAGFRDAREDDEAPATSPIHAERSSGIRRASIRDFHSLRVTWVTVALTAGVPLELVQKVTGHKTVDVVLKHYFQPGREEFRRALQSAMPKLLTSGAKTPRDQMLEILDGTTAKTWERDAARLRELVAAL
jgi:integrase